MRVFVTGSTGFVGTAVVKELLAAGHTVLGLARSAKGASQLASQGAESVHGTIQDTDVLSQAAATCDGVIHLAFVHDFSNLAACCATDREAITALGSALKPGQPLIMTSGTMMLPQGKLVDEHTPLDASRPLAELRGPSEKVCLDFASKGVRAMVVRLPPTTHGPGVSGFLGLLVHAAIEKSTSAYVGDGQNKWSGAHREDAARVYRLALEKGQPGSVFHAVTEQGVALKDIATEIGRQLGLPVVSVAPDKAGEHFGAFAFIPTADNPASSTMTKQALGWVASDATVLESVAPTIAFVQAAVEAGESLM